MNIQIFILEAKTEKTKKILQKFIQKKNRKEKDVEFEYRKCKIGKNSISIVILSPKLQQYHIIDVPYNINKNCKFMAIQFGRTGTRRNIIVVYLCLLFF